MILIFFQNCVSPHQVPYIKELSLNPNIENVFLVVPRYDYNKRQDMGWDNKKLIDNTAIKLIYKPSKDIVQELLKINKNIFCFFSGIRADKDVFNWFKESINYQVKRYIITEPPYTFNKPLWMHYIRFFLQDYKFVKYIDGVFAIGEDAVKYYRSISNKWKVFPFLYVTEHNTRTKEAPSGNLKLLFVGNLCKRKNVKVVIKALKGFNNIKFTIVGNGEERRNIEKIAYKNKINIAFEGTKKMKEIPSIMQEHDILILPSLHDGWGAVVNEAMDLGLYVIVSNKCGARIMINKGENGDIFISNNKASLKKILITIFDRIQHIRLNTNKRIKLFHKFHGKSVAEYFINCLKS